jgi:hypothetical protein
MITQGAKMSNPTTLEHTAQTLQNLAQDLHLRAEALVLREKLTTLLDQLKADGEILDYEHLQRDYYNPIEVVFYLPWHLFRQRQYLLEVNRKIDALKTENFVIVAYADLLDE